MVEHGVQEHGISMDKPLAPDDLGYDTCEELTITSGSSQTRRVSSVYNMAPVWSATSRFFTQATHSFPVTLSISSHSLYISLQPRHSFDNLFFQPTETMKFTGLAISLAFAGIASAAAIPGVPGVGGTVAGVEGAAAGTLAGLTHGAKRQLLGLGTVAPVTESVGSSMNGVTGITGSAVGTAGSTVAGAVGTAEKTIADTVPCMSFFSRI